MRIYVYKESNKKVYIKLIHRHVISLNAIELYKIKIDQHKIIYKYLWSIL